MKKIYCIEFSNKIKPYYGFIKPWNGVRDEETYSITYLPPSFINGIELSLGIKNKIIRHKLLFDKNGMQKDFNSVIVYEKNNKKLSSIHTRHLLVNPVLILGFETYEDAKNAIESPLYFGQNIYPIYGNNDFGIREYTEEEFDKLKGVETFPTTEDNENSIYIGNNRLKNNEKMYINIVRNEWYEY